MSSERETARPFGGETARIEVIRSVEDYWQATRRAEDLFLRLGSRDDERELAGLIAAIDAWESRRPPVFWVSDGAAAGSARLSP